MEAFSEPVETREYGTQTAELYDFLNSRVIGQERAVRRVATGFTRLYSGLKRSNAPIGLFMFVGPTGWGKTLMAEELSRFLIADNPQAPVVRIPCSEFSEQHAVSALVGAPPSYVGFDRPAMLEQLKIDDAHFWVRVRQQKDLVKRLSRARAEKQEEYDKLAAELHGKLGPFYSVILFDEVEKAHASLWNYLLHIVGDGELPMRSGSKTLFHNSVIILTSNVGGVAQQELLQGKTHEVGFHAAMKRDDLEQDAESMDKAIYRKTIEFMKDKFPPEMMGRFKEGIVVFRALRREQCRPALNKMLRDVDDLLLDRDGIPVRLHYTPEMMEHLLDEGVSREYGLRNMRDKIEKIIVNPVAIALESGDIREGDHVLFRMVLDESTGKQKPRMFVKRQPQPEAQEQVSEAS